jgi:general secretion pathway protein B
MSYILEALKKSQQERELGHVPTLETPSLPLEEEGVRPSPWILLALILAALAVVIALYSALRGGHSAPDVAAPVAEESGSAGSAAGSEVAAATQPIPPEPARYESAESGPRSQTSAPVPVAPPATDPTRPDVVMEAPAAPEPRTVPPPRTPPAADPAPAPAGVGRSQVPEDLIADIEAFKQEVRAEKREKTPADDVEEEIPPQRLRLPKNVRKRLPDFVMTAHIYDRESSKRFVLINGIKTREERTLWKILPSSRSCPTARC